MEIFSKFIVVCATIAIDVAGIRWLAINSKICLAFGLIYASTIHRFHMAINLIYKYLVNAFVAFI